MGRGRDFLERLAEESELLSEPIPGQPVVEIVSDRRVLIENHHGVKAYSREKLIIGVKYGCITLCGCGLEILRMTKEQLVISGRIDAVILKRRNRG